MQNKLSQNSHVENKPSLDDVLEELLEEAQLLDDHGSVIIGQREDQPGFRGDSEKKDKIEKKEAFS